MNVSFHLNERLYVLQMGLQPLGICLTDANRVHGTGTRYAVDKGPYFVRLHYEVGK